LILQTCQPDSSICRINLVSGTLRQIVKNQAEGC
jgi:hypothetical protein